MILGERRTHANPAKHSGCNTVLRERDGARKRSKNGERRRRWGRAGWQGYKIRIYVCIVSRILDPLSQESSRWRWSFSSPPFNRDYVYRSFQQQGELNTNIRIIDNRSSHDDLPTNTSRTNAPTLIHIDQA